VLFKPLPSALIQRLLAGEQDVLTEPASTRAKSIRSVPCPRCAGAMKPVLNALHAFSADDPLPRLHAECGDCGHQFDPRSGLVLVMGNPGKVQEVLPLVGQDDE
jgi:hypothetical protein